MIVAGWADGYRNNTFRTFEALECPKRLLIGPWSHMSTGDLAARPAHRPRARADPLVRPLAATTSANGIDERAADRRSSSRRSTRPEPDLAEMRGEWRTRADVAAERLRTHACCAPPATALDELEVRGDVGTAAWISCAGRAAVGPAARPAADDARSLVPTTGSRSAEELEILGHPRAAADADARRCRSRTSPRGSATSSPTARRRSSPAAFLNLAHATAHRPPAPLEPGVPSHGRRSSSRRPRGSSSPATASGSRSPAPTGRTPGRRRRRARSRVDRGTARARAPGRRRAARDRRPPMLHARRRAATRTRPDDGASRAADRLAHRARRPRRARRVRRSRYGVDYDGAVRRARRGALRRARSASRRSTRRTPGRGRARAIAITLARGGRASPRRGSRCAPTPTRTTSSSTSIAEELGGAGIGRRERRFERTHPAPAGVDAASRSATAWHARAA